MVLVLVPVLFCNLLIFFLAVYKILQLLLYKQWLHGMHARYGKIICALFRT